MTEELLELVPIYGLWVIYVTIALGGLALPLPGSMLVIASGAFAAAGDLDLWHAMIAAYGGYLTGDQTAYRIARLAGPGLVNRMRRGRRAGAMIEKTEALLRRRGILAVFLSRTFVSPIGPWMSYLCGAACMKWLHFTLASMVGAACWVAGYALLGYIFADRLAEMAELANNAMGFIAAFAVAIGSAWWMRASWKKYKETNAAPDPALEPAGEDLPGGTREVSR